jgi:CDP-paratose 2-epimerase
MDHRISRYGADAVSRSAARGSLRAVSSSQRNRRSEQSPILITGGAGFIGTNLAHRLLSEGHSVLLYDNLSRIGGRSNVAWLQSQHGDSVRLMDGDVRDRSALEAAVRRASQVFHLAAQVAVTVSVTDPVSDFEINAIGTLNLLETLRGLGDPPPLVFTSTHKVYGDLADIDLARRGRRYEPISMDIGRTGIAEDRRLDFRSPHGCSKGAAEQYVIDYARTFGLPALVLRLGNVYGPHQCGNEDQGWVAHFVRCGVENRPLVVCGDGAQVRDLLYVDDLVEALLLAQEKMTRLQGQAFNVGGGPRNAMSLLELLDVIEELSGKRPEVRFSHRRPGDQRYYVSDPRTFQSATGWYPQVEVHDGVARLCAWTAGARRVPSQPPGPRLRYFAITPDKMVAQGAK